MLDHTNYILNLTEANNGGAVRWQKEYSAKVKLTLFIYFL